MALILSGTCNYLMCNVKHNNSIDNNTVYHLIFRTLLSRGSQRVPAVGPVPRQRQRAIAVQPRSCVVIGSAPKRAATPREPTAAIPSACTTLNTHDGCEFMTRILVNSLTLRRTTSCFVVYQCFSDSETFSNFQHRGPRGWIQGMGNAAPVRKKTKIKFCTTVDTIPSWFS